MKKIDFINDCEYKKKDDLKFAIITRDGELYVADISNDGKRYEKPFSGKSYDHHTLNVHTDYLQILYSKYFKENPNYEEYAKRGNFGKVIEENIKDGNIFFNNITSYEGPLFYLHGRKGYLHTPNNPTEEQLKVLNELKEDIKESDFNEITVEEFNEDMDYYDRTGRGVEIIDRYLESKNFTSGKAK